MSETAVHSFVIRFVQEDAAIPTWRGLIQHVQTHEEIHFTHLQDAIHFMDQYVPVTRHKDDKNGRSP